jgi:sacsin
MEIPQQWHHRLDQDVDNVFHANEYVGYEDDDGHFIVVKIVHAITTGGIEDLMSRYTRKYLVLITDEDEEGTKVSVLKLYKFVKGGKREKKSRDSHALVLYEGEARASESENSDESLKVAKKYLCEELKGIWRLNPEDRKRAIKRLYLKWHPDRNPDNPIFAENVFKFMQAQIEHLQKDEPLDDPEGDQRPSRSTGDTGWGRFYREWDHTAQQHQRSHQNESRSRSRSRGSGRGYHGVPFSAGDENFRVPRQPDEGRRWFRQATVDCKVLGVLCDQMMSLDDDNIAGHVCFMAHQVAEKALKAGMYAVCGLDSSGLKDHALTRHAYALQTENPGHTLLLASYTVSLETYYLDTRYPNRHSPPTIPADTFSPATALQAKENAENIYGIIETLLGCS